MTVSEDPIREWILSEGKATQITDTHPVGGGCINRAYRYETIADPFFVKTNRSYCPQAAEALYGSRIGNEVMADVQDNEVGEDTTIETETIKSTQENPAPKVDS